MATRGNAAEAAEVIVPTARRHYEHLTALAADVRADEPDAVHRMRVATRRLRSLLGSYPSAFPSPATPDARDELRWLGTILGHARDAEVLGDRFSALIDLQPPELVEGSVHQRLVGTQEDLYRAAHIRAVEAFAEPRYAALCALLDGITGGGHPVSPDLTLRGGLDTAYRQLRKAERRVHDTSDDDAELGPALHRLRKRAKKLRYAAEAVEDTQPSATDLAECAEELQTLLGEHQDGVVARGWILDTLARARDDDEDTFTYGLLYAAEQQRAREAPRRVPEHMRAIRRAYRALDFRG